MAAMSYGRVQNKLTGPLEPEIVPLNLRAQLAGRPLTEQLLAEKFSTLGDEEQLILTFRGLCQVRSVEAEPPVFHIDEPVDGMEPWCLLLNIGRTSFTMPYFSPTESKPGTWPLSNGRRVMPLLTDRDESIEKSTQLNPEGVRGRWAELGPRKEEWNMAVVDHRIKDWGRFITLQPATSGLLKGALFRPDKVPHLYCVDAESEVTLARYSTTPDFAAAQPDAGQSPAPHPLSPES